MHNSKRTKPNILVTGTPGVGKSMLCSQLAEITGMRWVDVSKFAVENNCLEEFDEAYNCPILDEDKLMDGLEESMGAGGNIIDYHSCEFFPERWFDIVFVLTVDNTTLYDRLSARGYTGKKLDDNVQCEIFQTILEEARNSYAEEIVHELQSTTPEELQTNVQRICMWIQSWFQSNK